MAAGASELDETRWWRDFEEERKRIREVAKRLDELDKQFKKVEEKARMKPLDASVCGTIDPTLINRVIHDIGKDQQDCNIAIHRTSQRSAVIWYVDPLTDGAKLRHQPFERRRDKDLLDPALNGSMARAVSEEMATLYQQGRISDVLLDRVGSGIDLRGPDALLLIRDQVDSPAASGVGNHLKLLDQADDLTPVLPSIYPMMDSDELRRILGIYGPLMVEEIGRVAERGANLRLFNASELITRAYGGSDLLARVFMPGSGFAGHDGSNIALVRCSGEAILRELEADFANLKNPVHAWRALQIILQIGLICRIGRATFSGTRRVGSRSSTNRWRVVGPCRGNPTRSERRWGLAWMDLAGADCSSKP